MKVKMLVSMHGPTVHREPGEIHEVSDEEGRSIIAAGFAVAYLPPIETAPIHSTTLAQPEKAVLPSPKPRRVRGVS